MALKNFHKWQYIKNKSFLECIAFAQCDFYLDWAITVLFYCAIHLVEMKLRELGELDNFEHKERDKLINETSLFKNVKREYFQLKRASNKYRYYCQPTPTRDYYNQLFEKFLKIEKELL